MMVDITAATTTCTAAKRHGVAQLASPINRSVIDLGAGRVTAWGSLSVVELGTNWSPCTVPPRNDPAYPPRAQSRRPQCPVRGRSHRIRRWKRQASTRRHPSDRNRGILPYSPHPALRRHPLPCEGERVSSVLLPRRGEGGAK